MKGAMGKRRKKWKSSTGATSSSLKYTSGDRWVYMSECNAFMVCCTLFACLLACLLSLIYGYKCCCCYDMPSPDCTAAPPASATFS